MLAADFLFRGLFRASDFRHRTSDFSLWTSALSIQPSDQGIPAESFALKADFGTQPMDLGICHTRPKPSAN